MYLWKHFDFVLFSLLWTIMKYSHHSKAAYVIFLFNQTNRLQSDFKPFRTAPPCHCIWTVKLLICMITYAITIPLTVTASLLTFLTRSNLTSSGGSGRTLLFRHPITSPWATAQSATQATRSPASSPPQPIYQQHPGCTQTQLEGSWIKRITSTQVPVSWYQQSQYMNAIESGLTTSKCSWIHLEWGCSLRKSLVLVVFSMLQ